MTTHGFLRAAAATPDLVVADPAANARHTIALLEQAERQGVNLVVFPEMGLTGYTCGDLFHTSTLPRAADAALAAVAAYTASQFRGIAVVGLPVPLDGQLFNAAAVVHRGRVLGVVPKAYLPTYKEFYDARYYSPAANAVSTDVTLNCDAPIVLEENVTIGPYVRIYTTTHAIGPGSSRCDPATVAGPVTIGRGTWVALGATVESAGRTVDSLGDAWVVTGDARAYVRGLGRHHVLALRGGGGVSSGARAGGRIFRLGGAETNAGTLDFGRDAFSLLRGFAANTFAGGRVAVANVDYRFPLLRVERGHGTWPLFIRQLHGAVFADAGHAWRGRFDAGDLKTSFGGELSADVVAGFALPLTLTAGVARGHDGAGRVADTTTYYVRLGRAF